MKTASLVGVVVAVAAAAPAAAQSAASDPASVSARAISAATQQLDTPGFWAWAYGPGIQASAAWEAMGTFTGQDFRGFLDPLLDNLTRTSGSIGFNLLHNVSMPFDSAVGDGIGLFPIAYLSRAAFYNETWAWATNPDLLVATRVADEYVLEWPRRLPDGTFSRDAGWAGEVDGNHTFLWADDQFMGTALLARLAALGAPRGPVYLDTVATMQLTYASRMFDHGQYPGFSAGPSGDGLLFHGFNALDNHPSCCKWGRANGWSMMAHVEVLAALDAVDPRHPLRPAILAIFQAHAAALARVQSADGRWHQVLNESGTYLETSATGMFVFALAEGVRRGWLDEATFGPVLQRAWPALAAQVPANGQVSGICIGTGVQTSVAAYQARPTDYAGSSPGLGSVFRAARSFFLYSASR